jgi:outer membrane lipoprotein-sorting protein
MSLRFTHLFLPLTAALSLTIGVGVSVRAQEPPRPAPPVSAPAPNIPAPAAKVLDDMVAAYQALTSYSGTIDRSVKRPDGPTVSVRSEVALVKPVKIRVTSKISTKGKDGKSEHTRTLISDGTDMFGTASNEPTTYRKVAAQPAGKNLDLALHDSGGIYLPQLGLLFDNPKAKDLMLPPSAKDITLKKEKLSGEEVHVITANQPAKEGAKITFKLYVSTKDNLLRRVSLIASDEEGTLEIVETYGNIVVNPTLPDSTFTFTPGPDQKLYTPPALPLPGGPPNP